MVKVIHWTLSSVTQIQHFQIFFLKQFQAIEAKFHMEPPWDVGNENLFDCFRSHDQDGCQAHMYGIKHKNLLRNQEADDLETWYTASGSQVLLDLFK